MAVPVEDSTEGGLLIHLVYTLDLHIEKDVIHKVIKTVQMHLVDTFASLNGLDKGILIRRVIGKVGTCTIKTSELEAMESVWNRDLFSKLMEQSLKSLWFYLIAAVD